MGRAELTLVIDEVLRLFAEDSVADARWKKKLRTIAAGEAAAAADYVEMRATCAAIMSCLAGAGEAAERPA